MKIKIGPSSAREGWVGVKHKSSQFQFNDSHCSIKVTQMSLLNKVRKQNIRAARLYRLYLLHLLSSKDSDPGTAYTETIHPFLLAIG